MSEVARRVSSKTMATRPAPATGGSNAWTLYVLPLLIVVPIITGLIAGNPVRTLGGIVSLIVLYLGAWLMRKGLQAEAQYNARAIAKAPVPRKLIASAVVAVGVFILALWGGDQGVFMSIVFAGLGFVGCLLAYGSDPRSEKGVAEDLARRSGVKTEDVIEAINEAEAKIRDIETDAGRLHNRDLTTRLHRIVDQARAVLAQIEKDPGDLRRARRFLVTYLDGTRDVVRKYGEQQKDLAETPLAENFRHVLETVERVFVEQEEILKRNESTDLEVQIEVLKTQLEREGVA